MWHAWSARAQYLYVYVHEYGDARTQQVHILLAQGELTLLSVCSESRERVEQNEITEQPPT